MKRLCAIIGLLLLTVNVFAQNKPNQETEDKVPKHTQTTSIRFGWAYGIGAEVEYRPKHWGLGLSGGYVPQIGMGGYLGLQWGKNLIDENGFVTEGGLFYGQENPLRAVESGLGIYALIGYSLKISDRFTLRLAPGFGIPLTKSDQDAYTSEFLLKLTLGSIKL